MYKDQYTPIIKDKKIILNKNSDETIGIYNAIRYIFPYIGWTAIILISLLIIWYISGIPIGINGITVL